MAIEKTDDAYQIFEEMDEKQIADEVQGVYAKTLVYQFEERDENTGRTYMVTGLSIKGVYEVAKSLVRHGYDVACDEAKITDENENEFKASCKATFKAPNGKTLTTYGYTKASKFHFKKGVKGGVNSFAYVQALSKAQRNALRTLIPEKFAADCIERFLAEKSGRSIKNITPQRAEGEAQRFEKPTEPEPEPPQPKTEKLEASIPTQTKVTLRFLKDAPAFIGIDMKSYGPFKAEDVVSIPKLNANSLVREGLAVEIVAGKARAVEKVEEAVGRADLIYHEMKYGEITLGGGEINVKFDPPIPNDSSVVNNFLCRSVLDSIKAEAETSDPPKLFDYQLLEDANGLYSIRIAGDVTEKTWKGLVNPCSWAAAKASEAGAK